MKAKGRDGFATGSEALILFGSRCFGDSHTLRTTPLGTVTHPRMPLLKLVLFEGIEGAGAGGITRDDQGTKN